jgi:ferredoxin, 2Fe-2S
MRLKFVTSAGVTIETQGQPGQSLMEAALDSEIPGIVAECGGALACGTCHVYVADAWAVRLPAPTQFEKSMIQETIEPRSTSRLSCQIMLADALDGLTVEVPAHQAS